MDRSSDQTESLYVKRPISLYLLLTTLPSVDRVTTILYQSRTRDRDRDNVYSANYVEHWTREGSICMCVTRLPPRYSRGDILWRCNGRLVGYFPR